MLEQFLAYIRDENLFTPSDKLLLAVSGGVDSMVMLHLFEQTDIDFSVAHCNFNLRGAESDSEEIFIRDYCGENGIELFVKTFETREYARMEGISIEMAARDLRYNWFEELRTQLKATSIVTAHHRDDLIETMLINLARGTGIRGLCGIQAKNDKVVRPLLFASRDAILAYAKDCKLPYKHDSSNDELIYQRNIIRHQIIPLFETINPAFRKNAANTAAILKVTSTVYHNKLQEIREKTTTCDANLVRVSISKLKQFGPLKTVCFELLHPFGFNAEQVRELLEVLDAEAGKTFFSRSHRLVKDREELLISPLSDETVGRYYIEESTKELSEPVRLSMQKMDYHSDFQFSRNRLIADLDFDKLQFPLILKKWEQGEYFVPLGMTGMKKLSDFFIDQKMSIPEKEACWILYSGRQVVWVVGRRLDDRFKITEETSHVFRMSMENA